MGPARPGRQRAPAGNLTPDWQWYDGNTMPTLTFKVSPAEARRIRAKARAEKCTLSAFLRTRVLETNPVRRRKIIIKKHPVSGLRYDATPGQAVTQAEIDACLADFP